MNKIIYKIIKPKISHELLESFSYREKEIKQYYPKLKLIKSEHKVRQGMCFNYALNDYSNKNMFNEDVYYFLQDHYKNTTLKKIRVGDLISIHDDIEPSELNVQHYAKIIKTDNTLKGTIIRSKWGMLGIWQGRIDNIPDIYGDRILFWRKK
jgi:hypothetical protein